MKVATAAEMRAIDRQAIEGFGVPGIALMENAGAAVARKVEEVVDGIAEKKICVFAGKGNNGGDGFVVARHLVGRGAKVTVFLLGATDDVAGDARTNLDTLIKMNQDVVAISGGRDWDKLEIAVAFADCLVDALVGTGFRGEVGGPLAEAMKIINTAAKPVVAVDIPSGVDADTGQVRSLAVRATYTVTLALPKPGLLLQPGAAYAGVVSVATIGMPAELLRDGKIQQNVIAADHVRRVLPRRDPWAHKGLNGRVALLAGSTGFTGAAALAATAAVRAGAGLVTLAVPGTLYPVLAAKLTEAMIRPLPESGNGAVGGAAYPEIAGLAASSDVMVVGPGLGQAEETQQVVRQIVREATRPLVIDADGLNALAGCTEILQRSEALAVITPHPGEMARLVGLPVGNVNADRLGMAREAAFKWGAIVVLKGAGTVVAFPDGEAFINTTGNAGLATGGTGDILAGVIAAFIAQGLSSHDAAVAGVFVHGLAGDIAAQRGMIGLAAGDLLPALPEAINCLLTRETSRNKLVQLGFSSN